MYVICIWSYEWWTEIWDLQCGPKIGAHYTLRNSACCCVFTYSVYELVAEDGRVEKINNREDRENKVFWN